jgi:hypothetical protein
MAKDQITLLTSIAAEMKRQNQFNIRQNLENKEYQAAQLAQQSGDALDSTSPEMIDDATDFKRRIKASMFTAKMGEKFTESGERAMRSNKEAKTAKKFAKFNRVKMADKKVGLATIVDAVEASDVGTTAELSLSLIKVNTDAVVHSLGGIRHVLGMQMGGILLARRAAAKKAKIEARDRANDKRDAEEARREAEEKVKKDSVIKVNVDADVKDGGKGGPGLGKLMLLGLVTAVTMAVRSMIDGWKSGGFIGLAKDLFFGNDKGGFGNAIAGAFKVGATFALAGLVIAGPVGALVGGIVGMAVGAFTGYFGSEGIGKMLDGAGLFISESFEYVWYKIKQIGISMAHWIYKPGQKGNVSANDTKAQFFGEEVNWTFTNVGKLLTENWNKGMEWLGAKITGWAKKIYDPTSNEVFGGLFTMPAWFDTVEEAIGKMWGVLGDVGNAVKNALIYLLPDAFTDWAGWTVDGKIPNNNLVRKDGAFINPADPHGNEFTSLTAAAAAAVGFTGADIHDPNSVVSLEKVMTDYLAESDPIKEAALQKLLEEGDTRNIGMLTRDNYWTAADDARILASIKAFDPESNADEIMADLGLGFEGEGNGINDKFYDGEVPTMALVPDVTLNSNSDNSSKVGAVIINNNYLDGVSSSADIHTFLDSVGPMSPLERARIR